MVEKKSVSGVIFDIFNYLLMLGIAFICIVTIIHVIWASVSDPAKVDSYKGFILAPLGTPSLNAYKIIARYPKIWMGYKNTLIYLVIQCVVTSLLTVIAGYIASRKRFRYRNVLMMFLSFTMLFNGGMVPTYMVVRGLGMYNSRWAVIIPTAISMFNMIILRTAFADVPDALEESARLEGAGEWTVMTKIIVPLSKATIAVIVLYYAVGLWNSWFPAMIYLKDRTKYPLQLILREILLLNDNAVMTTSADAVKDVQTERKLVKYTTIIVSTVPIMCFYPFIQKYFTKGVMIGAVKG